MTSSSYDCLILLGPTASGKTGLGVRLAQRLNGEIISADSRQVFQGMDLGTGKDLHEYRDIPYHLINVQPAGTEYSVFDFQRDCYAAIRKIRTRHRLPLIVGGTALYLQSVIQNYRLVPVPENPQLRAELADLSLTELQQRLLQVKPQLHNSTDLTLRDRLIRAIEIAEGEKELPPPEEPPPFSPLILGLRVEPALLRQRIRERLHARLDAGMIEEARRLSANGVSPQMFEYYGLEYRYLHRFISGELNREEMATQLGHAIARFAKQQRSWFRRMEREGTQIHWLDGDAPLMPQAMKVINAQGLVAPS